MSFLRPLLALGLLVAAAWVGVTYGAHHHHEDVFQQLYLHLMPAQLESGPEGAKEPLVSVALPGFLGMFDMVEPYDTANDPRLALTNLQVFQVLSVLLVLVLFSGVAKAVRTGKGDALSRFFAGWCMWIRDEMVYPVMGKDLGAKFLPYFLVLFFFVAFMNASGLVPMGATATASIAVTGAMAVTTLLLMVVGGMVVQGPLAFWKNLVPHVPGWLWPLMFVVEFVGMLVKPFALMVRLFANMTGGHMVVLSFLGLIFYFAVQNGPGVAWAVSPGAVGFAAFIMVIEVFVALLQAYVFTYLSILFIGMSLHPDH